MIATLFCRFHRLNMRIMYSISWNLVPVRCVCFESHSIGIGTECSKLCRRVVLKISRYLIYVRCMGKTLTLNKNKKI